MSDSVEIKFEIEGIEELIEKLKAMDITVKSVMEPAAEAGAEIFRAIAEGMAPGPGIVAVVTEKTAGHVTVDIGPDQEHWYYKFVEQGAAPHEITGSPLVFPGKNGMVRAAKVSHPGMAARPFLRPAFDGNKQSAADKAGEVFKEGIDRHVK